MNVALLTMFNGFSPTYSLVNVVCEQVKMLLDDNINVYILISETCNLDERFGILLDDRIKYVKICNIIDGKNIRWYDYSHEINVHSEIFEEAKLVEEDLYNILKDMDVCIMHDIHYQGWHLMHNIAVNNVSKRLPNLKFIAFTHSMPANYRELSYPLSLRYSKMDNTTYVYPTDSGREHLSKQYNTDIENTASINNSFNINDYFEEDTKKIMEKVDLLGVDVLVVYPARLTIGKKHEEIAELMGHFKTVNECTCKIVFCDFESMDIKPEVYKNRIRSIGRKSGLLDEDMVFTSDIGFPDGISRKVVLNLFTLSNLFISPSYSESFGLTVLEAAINGNFIVLNEAVPAYSELGSKLDAYFLRFDALNFGYATTEKYHPSKEAYLRENSKKIYEEMVNNRVIKAKSLARTKYNPKYIYETQLKPLLIKKDC